ncbi:MAG: thiamine diphosphokinase [Spirochaetia bacterium]|nr:thiamine diphosphokinase [Spirochaetia bacterium]
MSAGQTALLVIGGDPPPFRALQDRLSEFSFICAADSGLDTLRAWNLRPDLVVGDMDSISNPAIISEYPGSMVFPVDKDDTDTEIGLAELRKRGYETIVMAGGGGGRLDHLLALRALLERPSGPDEWLCSGSRIVRLQEPRRFRVGTGATVSVFPLSGGAIGMHSEGLRWPLAGLSWDQSHFGISNMASSDEVLIDPGQRPVFVVLPLQDRLLDSMPL